MSPFRSTVVAPLDLPRLVMRRAAWVAVLVLLAGLVGGLARMGQDIGEEARAAQLLAQLMARLAQLPQADEASALQALREPLAGAALRHLELRVVAADGRLLLGPPAPSAHSEGGLLQPLLDWHRAWRPGSSLPPVSWPLARPQGPPWTISLTASRESERREAMASLVGVFALLLVAVAGLLLVMHWNVRRAFEPLGRLLAAIAGIESQNTSAVQALPAMPIRELEVVAAALRHLATALDQAEAQRRLLSRQVLTLQEDERARLARELHDEFGQRLTAMRADAAWLSRRLSGDAPLQAVVDGVSQQCQLIQQDVRSMLQRLQPFGLGHDTGIEGESPQRLAALLAQLVATWQAPGRQPVVQWHLRLQWCPSADAEPRDWPVSPADQAAVALPRALALAVYRASQEALTNVARHAQAGQAELTLCLTGAWAPGAALQLDWRVEDDGLGVADVVAATARGNGLAGLRERIWSQGGDLQAAPARPMDPDRPGLRLAARLVTRWLDADAAG